MTGLLLGRSDHVPDQTFRSRTFAGEPGKSLENTTIIGEKNGPTLSEGTLNKGNSTLSYLEVLDGDGERRGVHEELPALREEANELGDDGLELW